MGQVAIKKSRHKSEETQRPSEGGRLGEGTGEEKKKFQAKWHAKMNNFRREKKMRSLKVEGTARIRVRENKGGVCSDGGCLLILILVLVASSS